MVEPGYSKKVARVGLGILLNKVITANSTLDNTKPVKETGEPSKEDWSGLKPSQINFIKKAMDGIKPFAQKMGADITVSDTPTDQGEGSEK